MYKEYREMSRTEAVEALYQDMAARHRSRFRSIHVRRPRLLLNELSLMPFADPQSRGDLEDCRHQATIHEATPHQRPQIPSPSPRSQDHQQESLRRPQAKHLCLNAISGSTGGFRSGAEGSLLRQGCYSYFSMTIRSSLPTKNIPHLSQSLRCVICPVF